MSQVPLLVLLPGLDGSGIMFEPLLAVLPGIPVKRVSLADFPSEDRREQARILARQLDDTPCVIYAESYSGRLAYELARLPGVNIQHIIFAGSFLGRPSRAAAKAKRLPVWLLTSRVLPVRWVSRLLFGDYRLDLARLLHRAMVSQHRERLKQRLVNLAEAQDPVEPLAVPCTYVQATNDVLVDAEALNAIRQVCDHLRVLRFEGCHFMAQTRPAFCADLIVSVCREAASRVAVGDSFS